MQNLDRLEEYLQVRATTHTLIATNHQLTATNHLRMYTTNHHIQMATNQAIGDI